MSPSSRRKKGRGSGASRKVAGKITPVSFKSMSVGKENSRPTTRARVAAQHKPSVRAADPIDGPGTAPVMEPRVTRFSASVSRGRNSSPSDIHRALSDSRRKSRVSVGQPRGKVNNPNPNEKRNLGKRVAKDFERSEGLSNELKKSSHENEEIRARLVRNSDSDDKEANSSSIPVHRLHGVGKESRDLCKIGKALDELDGNFPENAKKKIRVGSCNNEKKDRALSPVLVRMPDHGNLTEEFLEYGSENKGLETKKFRFTGVGAGLGSRGSGKNEYSNKLREKLAHLEEKVKWIASNIEKTKEILDMENLDASEMILSDIHKEISGVEKAMGCVVGREGGTEMGSARGNRNSHKDDKDVLDAKSLVKGLNSEKVEARLFPHLIMPVEKDDAVSRADAEVQEVDNGGASVTESSPLNASVGKENIDDLLMADESIDEFDDQENVPAFKEEVEENYTNQLNDIGGKSSTAGWFVSEGESIILAHDDGSCSFYDIVNSEVKAEYKPPVGVSPNTWRDCWIVHAPGADGCLEKYIVAASAGNSVDPGFCSWDFYTKEVKTFHSDNETASVYVPAPIRTALAPISNDPMYRRNPFSPSAATENRHCWYRPCGPLMIAAASCHKKVQVYDIRDGDQLVKWELPKPVISMDYASPLHWQSKGKVVIAESDAVSLWDVSTPSSHALLSVSSFGQNISALHVNNVDAEQGGGVRQRITASDSEGNNGMFCTDNSIIILDFREPSGIGLRIPKAGVNAHSVFSCGDSIYIGCISSNTASKNQPSARIELFSLRKQKLLCTYELPESNSHHSFTALTQVWGNSSLVMGVCGLGLSVFDPFSEGNQLSSVNSATMQYAKETIGPDNMYSPSFDYMGSRVLLISRDRPACWRYLF